MANPQREHGHVDIANDIMSALCRARLPSRHWQVMMVVIRQTWGYVVRDKKGNPAYDDHGYAVKKKNEAIPLSVYSKMTGIERRDCHRVLRDLVEGEYVNRYEVTRVGRKQILYGFQKDYDRWKPLLKSHSDIGATPLNNAESETGVGSTADTPDTPDISTPITSQDSTESRTAVGSTADMPNTLFNSTPQDQRESQPTVGPSADKLSAPQPTKVSAPEPPFKEKKESIQRKTNTGEPDEPAPFSDILKNEQYDFIANAALPLIHQGLENACLSLKQEGIFTDAYAFKNKSLNQGRNERAILRSLTQCLQHKPEVPWEYCTKILGIEEGNYSEREHIRSTGGYSPPGAVHRAAGPGGEDESGDSGDGEGNAP